LDECLAEPDLEAVPPPRAAGYTRQPFGITAPQPVITDPLTLRVAELAAMAHELELQLLDRLSPTPARPASSCRS
jgi:hypothetical protein